MADETNGSRADNGGSPQADNTNPPTVNLAANPHTVEGKDDSDSLVARMERLEEADPLAIPKSEPASGDKPANDPAPSPKLVSEVWQSTEPRSAGQPKKPASEDRKDSDPPPTVNLAAAQVEAPAENKPAGDPPPTINLAAPQVETPATTGKTDNNPPTINLAAPQIDTPAAPSKSGSSAPPPTVDMPAVRVGAAAPSSSSSRPATGPLKMTDQPAIPPESIDGVTYQFTAGPADLSVPYQVPSLPPHFVPRAELLAIKKLLLTRSNTSLAPITLHGPSGAGKTALAIALAHDTEVLKAFPDGILMVSLGPDGDPQHAQSLWGAALGNDLSSLPDTGARAAALRALLQDRHCLLIIDDVTDTEQVKALNVGGSNCVRVITTDKADEITYALKTRRYAIGKLSETEALSLITEWAGILPDIYLPTVKEIIRRLGNFALPLALVGAQARQGITWLRLLEVLRDDQGPISNLNPDEPDVRKNAVGLVMNLVLSRFGGQQMQRSALLGVFAAGMGAPFAIDAAAACWEMSPEEARAALDLMVETALLQFLPGDVYVLHTALRDHLRRSANAGALQGATTRVREHYAGLVEQASVSSRLIDMQLGQIMAVFRQTSELDPDQADAFANSLISYFEQRGLWANQVMLTAAIVEEAQKAGDLIREHAYLSDLGYAQTVLGNLDQARRYFQRELDVSQKIGDPPGEAGALNNIGAIAERDGRYDEAETYYRRSLDIRNSLGNRDDIAETLLNIAGSLYYQKRWDDALNTFQRVLDMFGVLGNRFGQAQTWLNIGAAYENMARDSEALMAYQQSLAIYSNLNEEAGQSQALNNIGIVYLNQGDTERALSHFKRSLALKERLGDRSGQASTLNNIALLYENTGSATLALEHYEQSYKLLTTLDDRRAELVQENIDKLREKMGK